MFKEKVNARTDRCTHAQMAWRTTDNRPWHKIAGLRPVELKSLENCLITKIYLVQGPLFRQKSMERNKTQSWSVSHGDWHTCQKSVQYLQAFRKKVVWLLKLTKSKARNFAKNQWSVMKLKADL